MNGVDETDKRMPHYEVTAGLIWKEGKLLIATRPKGTHLEGFWEFPGGKQEEGEDLRECLKREIEEELGIEVRVDEPFLTVDHEYRDKRISLHVFNCTWLMGEPLPLQSQKTRWIASTDLSKLAFPPPDVRVIETLIRSKKTNKRGHEMFYKRDDNGYMMPAEGVRVKTLVHGDKTHLCEFRINKGSMLPEHSHPHEQTGYLVSGRIKFIVGDEDFEAGPGDSWCLPGGIVHAAEILEDSVVVEVFSPVREDFL